MKSLGLCLGIIIPCLGYSLTMEDAAIISDAFARTNTPQQVKDMLYPLYTNVWYVYNRTNPEYAREVQYNILTNLVAYKSNDVLFWINHGLRLRRRLFYTAYTLEPTSNDVEYLNICADYLGQQMKPVVYEYDLPNQGYSWYSKEIVRSKRLLVERFKELVKKYESKIQESEHAAFRTNITTRARLTEEERRIVWPAQ